MILSSTQDYRSLLKDELERRAARNPRYSLRSFARDLELSPARLSDVLRGRYGLSREAAEKIAARLGWSAKERDYFATLVDSAHARSRAKKAAARAMLGNQPASYQQLSLDAFQVISDWQHYAILELALCRGFKSNSRWIAKRLGISVHAARAAVERLLRLELMKAGADGTLKPTSGTTASPDGVPSEAIRKFHRQILEKALAALETQSVAERDYSSMVLAVDRRQIPEAKEELRRFRRAFDAKFGQDREKNSVYCLSLKFFRLEENPEETR